MTGESIGSTAMAVKLGLRGLSASTQPVIVPPVPTADTKMSIFPSVSSHNSSAVVFAWIAGFAGLLNCCGIHAFGVFLTRSSAREIAPFIPSAPGVSTSFAPSMASSVRRSTDIVSGIVRMSL